MTTLLAIDGSLRCVGLALFRDARLVWTGAVHWRRPRDHRPKGVDLAERARILADEACDMLRKPMGPWPVNGVIYEWPQVYDDETDANDLFGIVAVSAAITRGCLSGTGMLASVLPRVWTAGIPKKVNGKLPKNPRISPRALRILSRLDADPSEQHVFLAVQTNDEIDAVGIGLHHLGRGIAERKRVYPGAV